MANRGTIDAFVVSSLTSKRIFGAPASYCCWCWMKLLLVLTIPLHATMLSSCGVAVVLASSSSSSRNYSPYLYDTTVPLFTPDGRLLQVEYAQSAADHSSPIVAAVLSQDLRVMACCRPNAGTQQQRLVLLPPPPSLSSSSSSSATNSNSGTATVVVLALSGILADCLSLLQTLQGELMKEHRLFGGQRPATAARVASIVARECHSHAFGGGLRALGATLLMADAAVDQTNDGVNDEEQRGGDGPWTLYRMDPSGAIQTLEIGTTAAATSSVASRITILGGGSAGSVLQRRLERDWSIVEHNNDDDNNNNNDENGALERKRLGQLLQIIVDEHQRDKRQQRGSGDSDEDNEKGVPPVLEVVLLSASMGATKLSQEQVRRLLAESTSISPN